LYKVFQTAADFIDDKTMHISQPYKPDNQIRIVTAASLFDGHDAAINIMRRIMQRSGAEIIHLGHNRSVGEIVACAIQEDVQGIAITSYQGGHVEFFKYMYDLLHEKGAGHIKIFGGGGGTILPFEAEELHQYGITRIYSPDDGRAMGLQGMINDLLEKCDFPTFRTKRTLTLAGEAEDESEKATPLDNIHYLIENLKTKDPLIIGRLITVAETSPTPALPKGEGDKNSPFGGWGASPPSGVGGLVLGITGTGGAGKSSMVDELVRRYLLDFPDKTIAVISVDPSKRKTGGALLGDRIRMNAIFNPRVYMRSLATRQSNLALSRYVQDAIDICKAAEYDLIIVETSGIGQSDTEIVDHSDVSLYIMTSDFGAATQLEKIDMLDFADVIAINKFDKRGSLDALRDVRKQYKRNHNFWDTDDESLPVYGTIASQFNDPGTNILYRKIVSLLNEKAGGFENGRLSGIASPASDGSPARNSVIPPERTRYLAEIVESSLQYDQFVKEQTGIARKLYQFKGVMEMQSPPAPTSPTGGLTKGEEEENSPFGGWGALYQQLEKQLHYTCRQLLDEWPAMQARYRAEKYQYQVRDKVFEQDLYTETLSHHANPKSESAPLQRLGRCAAMAADRKCTRRVSVYSGRISAQT